MIQKTSNLLKTILKEVAHAIKNINIALNQGSFLSLSRKWSSVRVILLNFHLSRLNYPVHLMVWFTLAMPSASCMYPHSLLSLPTCRRPRLTRLRSSYPTALLPALRDYRLAPGTYSSLEGTVINTRSAQHDIMSIIIILLSWCNFWEFLYYTPYSG